MIRNINVATKSSPAQHISLFSSVQAKIIGVTILVTTLVLGGFAAYDVKTTSDNLRRDLIADGNNAALRLASTLSTPMWDLDAELVADTLLSEMLDRDVYAAVVTEKDKNEAFSGYERDATWNAGPYAGAAGSELIRTTQEIRYRNDVIGTVDVWMSPRFIDIEVRDSMVRLIIILLALDLIILIVLSLVFHGLLVQPILRLSQAAERISRGEGGVELDTQRRDEIGLVATAIQRLQVSLGIAMDRLRGTKA